MTTRGKSSSSSSSSQHEEEEEEASSFLDLYKHRVDFLKEIPSFWNKSQFGLAQHQYSAVVISIGVWDIARGHCSNLRRVRKDLMRALTSTRDFVGRYNAASSSSSAAPSQNNNNNINHHNYNHNNNNTTATSTTTNRPLTVFWKTHGMASGFNTTRKRFCGDMIHKLTREWFLSERTTATTATTTTTRTRRNLLEEEMDHPPNDPNDPHMILVDFGLQVEPRTFDEKRIEGDNVYHFGPEARTLSIQLLSHEMHKSICRRKKNNNV
jgi:hypothetical protein